MKGERNINFRATFDAKEQEEALHVIDGAAEVIETAQRELEEFRGSKELRRVRVD